MVTLAKSATAGISSINTARTTCDCQSKYRLQYTRQLCSQRNTDQDRGHTLQQR